MLHHRPGSDVTGCAGATSAGRMVMLTKTNPVAAADTEKQNMCDLLRLLLPIGITPE
jgi:hypothetical protein